MSPAASGFDRLAERLLALARALARARIAARTLPPGQAWRRPDVLWPTLPPAQGGSPRGD
ncbi:hypothetical protein [Novosphingobium sp.]|uniref:hypothetical protein n=1 Tax=Novosphingobium sp. TaxID=1874826 RepID=UPI002630FD5A|nr:hypothetical protein [Novosphingobium sp.]